MASTSSSKSALSKIGLHIKPKPLRVVVLGQSGVGKTALVVRFVTRRYIGDYDSSTEKRYYFPTTMDDEMVYFEIQDTVNQANEWGVSVLEGNIRWAQAYILMYSVSDKCSFDECNRYKFLINYHKRGKKRNPNKDTTVDVPVVLVGNKTDQPGDRMISPEDGQKRSKEIGCVCFHEISVRENVDEDDDGLKLKRKKEITGLKTSICYNHLEEEHQQMEPYFPDQENMELAILR